MFPRPQPVIASLESRVHPDEWQARLQLAACYRVFAMLGWTEMIYNHITVRVPDTASGAERHFLINPFGLHYAEVTASNLVKIDLEGRVLDGSPYKVNPAGFVVHATVHTGLPDAHCVMHTHTTAGMAIAALEEGLLPISMYALGYFERIAYHDFEGPSLEVDERARLATNLGEKNLLVMKTHGLLACGETVAQAFVRLFRLERACQVQLAAQATGARLAIPPRSVCELSAKLSDDFLVAEGDKGYSKNPNPEFAAMMRLMDRKDPSYRL